MQLVELSDMSIYMDAEAKSLANLTHAQFYDTFAKLVLSSIHHLLDICFDYEQACRF